MAYDQGVYGKKYLAIEPVLVDNADIDWLQPFRNEVHRGVRYGEVHLVEAAIASDTEAVRTGC